MYRYTPPVTRCVRNVSWCIGGDTSAFWCIVTKDVSPLKALVSTHSRCPRGAILMPTVVFLAPWLLAAAYVSLTALWWAEEDGGSHRLAFFGSYTSQYINISMYRFCWCIAAIHKRYIAFLMYHLPTHRVRELMYRLDYTSRYITMYSYTAIQRDTSEMMYPHPSDRQSPIPPQ